MTPEQLQEFEQLIATDFEQGLIQAPIHLSDGNEAQLIEIFKGIKPYEWVLCQWRSHLHCLLRGVPPEEVRKAIHTGHSVSLCFPKYKIISSGIVGGTAPIAVGLAWAAKRKNDENYTGLQESVYVFIGDMTAQSGSVHEAMKYGARHQLPIKWIVEDNGKSVCTDTINSWGDYVDGKPDVTTYRYELTWPHSGTGKWVRF